MTPEAVPERVTEAVLDDLRERLSRFRSVAAVDPADSSLGLAPDLLAELIRSWRDDFDWRRLEDRIRALPWAIAGADDAPVRLLHQRAATADAPVAVLLHGWPDSVLRFERVLPLLKDFHLVVPALPGFPFSLPTSRPVRSALEMGDAIAAAMADLGYERYVVSGGDVGTDVAEAMAARHPEHVSAVHFTDVAHSHVLAGRETGLTEAESRYADAVDQWHRIEGGYNHQQSTRPNALAVGLGDSPGGLLAWVADRLLTWSGSDGSGDPAFSTRDLLEWVSVYWLTGAIGTSFSPYAHRQDPGPVRVPTVFTVFPQDIVVAPRSFAERFFDVRSWTVAERGGHFDAWERPADYAAGVRAAREVAEL